MPKKKNYQNKYWSKKLIKKTKLKPRSTIFSGTLFILFISCVVLLNLGLIGYVLKDVITEKLTPVNDLAKEIRLKSLSSIKTGSICNDGTRSNSRGRGSCSWHGGVRAEFYDNSHVLSLEEAKQEAIKRSWRDDINKITGY